MDSDKYVGCKYHKNGKVYSNLEKTYFPYILCKFTYLNYLDVHLLLKDIQLEN
jgi:hypothetical protein